MPDLESLPVGARRTFARNDLTALFAVLREAGYQVVGPVCRDGAIVYDELASPEELPAGWTDRQSPGAYRLERRPDGALFGYAVGPHSWKRFLHSPRVTLWRTRRTAGGFTVEPPAPEAPKLALLGVRACELAAIAIQDRVFLGGSAPDAHYAARRKNVLLIAVQCGSPGGTCFCASMGTGPRAERGYDLALTELLGGERHEFLAEVGSPAGARILERVPTAPATETALREAGEVTAAAARRMGRAVDTAGIRDLLFAGQDHPRWAEVAGRCLACANCTMACPTCFCSTALEVTDLSGESSERVRVWDSCFSLEFSQLAGGGSVRKSVASRYRQWMTHKLAGWHDQFGTSGCVGCGRCITWCPVGIDITAEAAAIRAAVLAPTREGAP